MKQKKKIILIAIAWALANPGLMTILIISDGLGDAIRSAEALLFIFLALNFLFAVAFSYALAKCNYSLRENFYRSLFASILVIFLNILTILLPILFQIGSIDAQDLTLGQGLFLLLSIAAYQSFVYLILVSCLLLSLTILSLSGFLFLTTIIFRKLLR